MFSDAALALFYLEYIWWKVNNSETAPGYLFDK